MSLAPAKSALRFAALKARADVSGDVRRRLVADLAAYGPALCRDCLGPRAGCVSVFLPIRDEPDTLPLLTALSVAGLATALPATPPRGEPLHFRLWRSGGPLVPGRFGTVEPPATAPDADPDVLFVPLAAFDRRGFRLGYGAGFYDGALHRLRREKPVLAVGIAFAAQEVAAVPMEPHDERLDAVFTEHGLLTFGSP